MSKMLKVHGYGDSFLIVLKMLIVLIIQGSSLNAVYFFLKDLCNFGDSH
jgi:hypothetical protein